jgi:ubiquinone biosynthesis protein
MHFGSVNRLNNINRSREVANVLIKHGFGFMFDRISLRKILGGKIPPQDNDMQIYSAPQRLRFALQELGPTFIKLGQLLSIRPDLLPADFISELERLQNDVPPFSFAEVKEVFNKNGIDMGKAYQSFHDQPIAAASIAQVHEAVLHNGDEVVVKVQRPGIARQIESDLDILFSLSRLLEKRTAWGRLYKISEIMDELGKAIRSELDFSLEARNTDTFRKNFRHDRNVKIPAVYWEYSSSKIITLERLEGIKVSDFAGLKQAGLDTGRIAARLVDALFKQIYEHGFFHADPHPGNLAVSPEHKIIFYDFGQVGIIDEVLKERCMDLLLAMMRYDVNGVTRALLSIAISSHHVNRDELRRDISKLEQKYYGLPMSQIKLGEALAELLELSTRYQVRIPPELSLMVKMLMTVESIVAQLDPQLSIVDIAEPYGRRVLLKRYSPSRISSGLRDLSMDYLRLLKNSPHDIEILLTL